MTLFYAVFLIAVGAVNGLAARPGEGSAPTLCPETPSTLVLRAAARVLSKVSYVAAGACLLAALAQALAV